MNELKVSQEQEFQDSLRSLKKNPWPAWLSWLGIVPQSKRLLVWFLVGAHAWVTGLVPDWGMGKKQLISVSVPY